MSRITQVFYGNDCLPYKDSERTVHYPITGSSFAGSSNVNELHFYVRDIGGVNNLSWVAIVKLPNGKILYQLLTDIHLDSELNEYYVTFNLSQFYTQLKGDIYISLNGCMGQVDISTDEETDISTIQGEIDSRTVVATGAVKFSINYAPQRPVGFSFDLDQYQTIINALAQKSNIISTIQIVANITQEDLSAFNDGQIIYSLHNNTYYKKIATIPYFELYDDYSGVLAKDRVLVRYNVNLTMLLNDLVEITGVNNYFILHYSQDYMAKFIYVGGDYHLFLYDLQNTSIGADFVVRYGIFAEDETLADYLTNAATKTYLQTKSLLSSVYVTDSHGNQTMIGYSSNANPGSIALRDSNGNINVNETPTNNSNATSKKYVDDIDNALRQLIDTVKRNAFTLVDTTLYPTLNSFLASTGEEGYIYLYPINTSDLTQGYEQYIWENNSWLFIGLTVIDLSDYYTKSQVNSLLDNKVNKRTSAGLRAYTHYGTTQSDIPINNDAMSNSIPLRDANGNFKVGTPSNSADATPKTYVDTLGLNLDNAKVDKTNSGEKVYGTDELGAQTTYDVDSDLVGSGAIVRRETSTGTVVVGTPTSNTHATTKSYVDTSIANAISNVYKIKGSATVSQINAMTTQKVGDVYNLLDSGTITLGELQVFTGDNIVWTGSAWDKLGAEIDWTAYDEKFIAAGFFEVQPYNENTGEITFVYSTELYVMSYDSDTGIMTINAN